MWTMIRVSEHFEKFTLIFSTSYKTMGNGKAYRKSLQITPGLWCISHKPKTKIHIYNSLIRSIIEYGAPLWKTISEYNLKKLDSIQDHALRIINKAPIRCSNSELHQNLKVASIFKK
ncbi:RNA-directed DNA polymerase from transposon [Brachionus plicatilis]|uniref:RNA-directed DNA polymerase from transposon n=1 Tax=Brachionus plicatilis TaxID=10195 RepID=A0A3M7R6A7_BRAPC|nr:RNA-directed DNA polymerase from transposon [Brachionus plicatilis]